MRGPQTEHTCRKCVKRHMPTAGHNMLHDRHRLRWDVEIWLLPCETTRQRLNISPLSTPSSGRLLFWNLELAGTLFWSLLPPERHYRRILFWHSADPSWTDFNLKNNSFSFFLSSFLPFFLSSFLPFFLPSFLPFLSFPFLLLDGSAAPGELYLLSLVPFLNSIQIIQLWKTPTDLIIPDIALSHICSSFVD